MDRMSIEPNYDAEAQGKPKPALGLVFPLLTPQRSLDFLIELVRKIRPSNPRQLAEAERNFQALLYQLRQEPGALYSTRKALLTQFSQAQIMTALTESGMVSGRGVVQEITGKLKHKFLPAILPERDFLFVIRRIFYKPNDYLWVEGIRAELWIDLFNLLGIQVNLTQPQLLGQMQQALQWLSYRLVNLGLERELTDRYEGVSDVVFPFVEQNRLVQQYLTLGLSNAHSESAKVLLANVQEYLHNCNQSIQWIRDQRHQVGTSLAQTFVLGRLQQQIDRMFLILDALDANHQFDTSRFVNFFQLLIRYENRRNSIREFLSANTAFLAYQIAEHSGRTGERYIAGSSKELRMMFRSAMGGGLIISFIAMIKTMLGKWTLAPFWQGFLYSVNYSLGFVLIQDTGSTLATKQPAYTANNVASSLDARKVGDRPDLRNLAITLAKVSRTQIASFVGNLIVVFPGAFALAWAYAYFFGSPIVDESTAQTILRSQQPLHSLALLYACFTGFFLFLSGLIAGYVENHVVYGRIGERFNQARFIKHNFSEARRYRMVQYINSKLGALVGNLALGFFLGMAGFIGYTFGLPFDIRHITISAANVSISAVTLGNSVAWTVWAYTLVGVALIGFLNFAVSFGLAFLVAVKSRGIHLRDYPQLVGIVWRYFLRYPRDFFRAPAQREAHQLGE